MDIEEDRKIENVLCASIYYKFVNNQIELHVGLLDTAKRRFYIAKFTDNDHFSNFESLLI